MNEQEVEKLFLEGYNDYKNNQPEPTPFNTKEKIKRLGWKLGKQHKVTMELALDTAIEAFVEKNES